MAFYVKSGSLVQRCLSAIERKDLVLAPVRPQRQNLHAVKPRIERAGGYRQNGHNSANLFPRQAQPLRAASGDAADRALTSDAAAAAGVEKKRAIEPALLVSTLLVLVLGVLNRVLNKMALVPMGNYLFFLAQLQTFGYVLFYGCFLALRKRSGIVTDEMLKAPNKQLFVLIGALEAVAQVVSMICVSKLPGVVLPLLQQTILLWQVLLGWTVQGQRYALIQVFGIALVGAGVGKAAWPSGAGGSILGKTPPVYAAIFCFAFFILASVAVIKDIIFTDAKKKLGGQPLDLFVVNTAGSAAQAVFVFFLLPVLSSLQGIPFSQLPTYLSNGFKCFLGMTPGSSGAPLIPLAYIAVNLAMNISVLNLLRTAGPVITTLSMSLIIPLTIWAFTFPWPLIGSPAVLNANFVIGTGILLAGLLAYNSPTLTGQKA